MPAVLNLVARDRAVHQGLVAVPGSVEVAGMQEGPERSPDQLIPAVAQHRLQRRVGDEKPALGIG